MDDGVMIRRARPDEQDAVAACVRTCGKYVRSYFSLRDLGGYYTRGEVWVADDGGTLAGFAVGKLLKRFPMTTLEELGVRPEYRGQRLGGRLLRAAAQGRPLRFVVEPDNITAVTFYLNHGLTLDYPEPVPTRSGKRLVWRMSGRPTA